jgi:uncharacterized RDD family membrane protein YckC
MSTTLYCNQCGAPNTAEARFCSRCGGNLNPVAGARGPSAAVPAAPAPVAAASYPPVAAVGVGYGGFWIRVIAFIVDTTIVRAAAWPLSVLFGLGGLGMMGGFPHGALGMHLFGGGLVVTLVIFGSWLYEAFMLSSPYQATLGKMILGMKVTDLYGNRISFGQATARHFAKWLSGLTLCIGYIMVGITERKQGLHDLLAGTLVRR